jgi:hypothetical protein
MMLAIAGIVAGLVIIAVGLIAFVF